MIAETMTVLLASPDTLVAASDSDSSASGLLWLLGPAAGLGFYGLTFVRYRNVDKRHAHERQTASDVVNPTGFDNRTGRVTDVENSRIRGDNSGSPRTRLGARSSWSEE